MCLTGLYNPRSPPAPRGPVTAVMRDLSCLAGGPVTAVMRDLSCLAEGVDFYHTKFLALVHAK